MPYNLWRTSSENEKLKWTPEIICFLKPYFLASSIRYFSDSIPSSPYLAIGISWVYGNMHGIDWNHRYSSSGRWALTKSAKREKTLKASSIELKVGVIISIWLSEKSVVIKGFFNLSPNT